MDLSHKIGIAGTAIESIARHEDEEAGVRLAALEQVSAKIEAERVAINARVQARIEQLSLPRA